jgi:outer membrane protein assembly factor BamB
LNGDDGSTVWSFPLERPSIAHCFAVSDNTVYYGTADLFYALDISTGREKWRYQADGLAFAVPPVSVGTMYLRAGKTLYAIDAATGGERWRCALNDHIRGCPTVWRGLVYCVGLKGDVYAVVAEPEGNSEEKK